MRVIFAFLGINVRSEVAVCSPCVTVNDFSAEKDIVKHDTACLSRRIDVPADAALIHACRAVAVGNTHIVIRSTAKQTGAHGIAGSVAVQNAGVLINNIGEQSARCVHIAHGIFNA